jgi:large subunit ribosomal protein L35
MGRLSCAALSPSPSLAFAERRRYKAAQTGGGPQRGARPFAATSDTDDEMPKLKSKSGAKKRFGRTATGKIKRNWGHKRHLLINKSKQGKRLRRGTTTLETGDAKLVLTYMPYLRG